MKINSHFGVRTDLFQRTLSETRITDFFGGVAQAEIVSPISDTFPSATDEEDLREETLTDKNLATTTRKDVPPSVRPSVTQHKMFRAWGSVILFGSLIGWVASRKRVR